MSEACGPPGPVVARTPWEAPRNSSRKVSGMMSLMLQANPPGSPPQASAGFAAAAFRRVVLIFFAPPFALAPSLE
jgi:hypothetical protein